MLNIKKQYIVNEKKQKVGIQMDIATFSKIEQILEDYALGKLIEENENDVLNFEDAKTYYQMLNKD